MTTTERLISGGQTLEQAREPMTERSLSDALRRMLDSVRPDAIFGSPVEREGVVIIPCSEVSTGFGMGGGSGFGPAATAPTASQTERTATTASGPSGGGGLGGGGGAQGCPVAVIVVSQGEARVLPVVDVTKLLIFGLTTAGFVTLWLTQALGRPRGGQRGGASPARFSRAIQAARRWTR